MRICSEWKVKLVDRLSNVAVNSGSARQIDRAIKERKRERIVALSQGRNG